MIDPRRFRAPLEAAAGLAMALVVWFGGRLLGASDDVRFLGALAAALAGLLSSRRDFTVVAEVGRRVVRSASADEDAVATMRARLIEGLREMQKATGRHSRYALPWYLVLGPEGAGKTTLLDDCGLERVTPPAASAPTRPGAVAVTAEAAFVDTAGAYVMAADLPHGVAAGWEAVLGELVNMRPMLPLNGVILAVSAGDLYLSDAVGRQSLAEGIRARLREVQAVHDAALPVYVLLTKLDMIPGFIEFFTRMDSDERDQPWGFVLPLPAPDAPVTSVLAGLNESFARLVAGLAGRRLNLLHQEPVRARAARIDGFPAKVAVLLPALSALMETVFAPLDGAVSPVPRGVFLTSSRQDGLTVDPLMPEMSARFAVGRPLLAASAAGAAGAESQPWFIARPMRETILVEAGLARRRRDPYGRRVMTRRVVTAVFATLCLGYALYLAQGTRAILAEQRRILAEMDVRPQNPDHELSGQLRALEILVAVSRSLPPSLGLNKTLGDLDHAQDLREARQDAEERIIDGVVLPRLASDLRSRLFNPALTTGELAADLALVRMLGDEVPPASGMLSIWLEEAVERVFPQGREVTPAQHRMIIDRTLLHLMSPHRPHLVDEDLLAAMEARMGETK